MKTYSATPKDIEKSWILIDANGLVVGNNTARTGGMTGRVCELIVVDSAAISAPDLANLRAYAISKWAVS